MVNENVADYEQLIADLQGSDNNRIIEVVVLESDRDGIEQVSEILSERSDLAAVHFITHGADGQINLGDSWLNGTTLQQNSDAVAGWGNALTETGDILFYGCNIAADSDGQTLLSNIAALTGADVTASVDPTGHTEKGGDWELEYVSGAIETKITVPSDSQQDWSHLLAAPSDLQVISTANGGLSINEDGGNDAYLIADDGAAIFGGLTEFSIEAQFSAATPPTANYSDFVSYATSSQDEEVWLAFRRVSGTNFEIQFSVNGLIVTATGYNAYSLFDGEQHALAVTWNSSGGAYEFFINGASVYSNTGLKSGYTLQSGGTLTLVRDQDSPGGGFDLGEVFQGTLHDLRVFNHVRSNAEIAANYRSTLPYDEPGLLANWTFDDFSVDATTGNRIVTDTVSGNNLTAMNVGAGGGYVTSTPELTLSIDENSNTGTVVGTVLGTDPDRDATIASLLAADPELHYNAETGKFYKVVFGWFQPSEARTNAESTTLNTVNGQLATIRSAAENEFVRSISASIPTSVWLGGTDATVEGEWRWIESGAEADQFWSGAATGDAVNGAYQNWVSGSQPNDMDDEDYMRMNITTGEWWDDKDPQVHSYVVEWKADDVLDATDALTYSIQSQSVAGAFSIDADSGEITVADGSLLDYETNTSHNFTVRVTDSASNTYDEVFTIQVKDSNDAPTITSNGGGPTAIANAQENTTAVTTVTATDPDGDTPTFSITGGADAARFDIDPNSGELTFKPAPDFENPTDSDTDNVYVVEVTADDGNGGTDVQTISVTVTDNDHVLWISTDQDAVPPGADGLPDGWREGEVLHFGGPDLSLGSATDGDFARVIDFDLFTADSTDPGALHFVSRDLTIGSGANQFDLQIGDILVSFNQDEDILATYYETGAQTTVHKNDLLAFRPDTPGDYTSGTFYMLLNGVPDPDGNAINSLHAISLVEQDTYVGGTLLTAGSFLFSEQTGVAPNTPNHIYHFAPTDAGQATAAGTSQILIDGNDIDIELDKNIRGLELIEKSTTIGGLTLDSGDILVTLSVDDASVGNAPGLSTSTSDIFVLKVTQSEPEAGITAGTAEMVLDGSDVNLSGSERIYTIALVPDNHGPAVGGDDTGTVTEDVGVVAGNISDAGTLTIADLDPGESFFTAETIVGTYGSLTIDAAGNWTYTADNSQAAIQNLDVGESLSDVLMITTADGTTQRITITINGTEDAPVIGGTFTGSVTEDGTLTTNGTLTISDVDTSDNPISFPDEGSTLGDNSYGNFVLTAGSWTYTLNNTHAAVQALDAGETLTDTHTFTASDGSTRLVTITINGSNDAPVANDDPGDFVADLLALNPLSYWRLGETSGSAADIGSSTNNGTYNGGTLGQTGAINGDSDTTVRFDATNSDYVAIAHSNDYLLDDGTVQLWFNVDTAANGDLQHLFSKDSSGFDTGGHLSIYLNASGKLEVRLQSATADYYGKFAVRRD